MDMPTEGDLKFQCSNSGLFSNKMCCFSYWQLYNLPSNLILLESWIFFAFLDTSYRLERPENFLECSFHEKGCSKRKITSFLGQRTLWTLSLLLPFIHFLDVIYPLRVQEQDSEGRNCSYPEIWTLEINSCCMIQRSGERIGAPYFLTMLKCVSGRYCPANQGLALLHFFWA